MKILAFFTSSGSPVTGLNPTIRIRDLSDNSLVVTDGAMTEVGDGHYQYNFTSYDKNTDYAIRCDGGITLNNADRYTYAGNENYIDDIGDTVTETTSASFNEINTNVIEVNTNVLSASANIISDIEMVPNNIADEVWSHSPSAYPSSGSNFGGLINNINTNVQNISLSASTNITTKIDNITTQITSLSASNEANFNTVNNNISNVDNNVSNVNTNVLSLSASNKSNFSTVNTNIDNVNTNVLSVSASLKDVSLDLKRLLGLTHENIFIDNPSYDSDGNLVAARVRIYSNPASVGTASNVIGVYEITAPSNAPGQFTSWKQVRTS